MFKVSYAASTVPAALMTAGTTAAVTAGSMIGSLFRFSRAPVRGLI